MRHHLFFVLRWTGRFLYYGLVAIGVGMTGNSPYLLEEVTRYWREKSPDDAEPQFHPETVLHDVPPSATERALWSQFDRL